MKHSSALLLRAISEELTKQIIPNLTAADAIERAHLSAQILQYLAADIDVLAEISEKMVPQLRTTLNRLISGLPASAAEYAMDWHAQLNDIKADSGLASQREVHALRTLSGTLLRQCASLSEQLPDNADKQALQMISAELGQLDYQWLSDYAQARELGLSTNEKQENEAEQGSPQETDLPIDLSIESITKYLQDHFPKSPSMKATKLVSVPGGRSKKTWFISIEGSDELPSEVVMRQDYQLHYEGTKVRDEYLPLKKLSALNLPVPAPLYLEEDSTELGQPFLLMEKANGSPPGSYFGLQKKCRGAFEELATTLAKVHTADPLELGYTLDDEPENSLSRMIDSFRGKWSDNSIKPSPLVDYAFAWAKQVCALDSGTVAVVHGDVGPHNMLVEGDSLEALLDWEFAHVGDPAEDLGIVRVYAEDVMQWDEFMQIYIAAGGRSVPERRIEVAMVLHFLKGASLVAVSNRNFEEGWTKEFIKGGTAFAGLRQIEMIIAKQLKRFGAIKSTLK